MGELHPLGTYDRVLRPCGAGDHIMRQSLSVRTVMTEDALGLIWILFIAHLVRRLSEVSCAAIFVFQMVALCNNNNFDYGIIH